MQLHTAFRLAVLLGVFEASAAFVVNPTVVPAKTTLSRGRPLAADDGYSDDFLRALQVGGGDNNNDERSNDDSSGDDEIDQGGSRFREMMKRAKESPQLESSGSGTMVNPFANDPGAPLIETTDQNEDELSMEEQARLFRKFMEQSKKGGKPAAPSGGKQLRGGMDAQGRPVGRNRDTDTIANTSDLYFAQLKRDSSVRTRAFHNNEYDTADAVFADDGVKKLKDMFKENPYLKQKRDEEAKMIETAAEEMLAIQTKPEPVDKSSAGVSYKEKLAAMKAKKSGKPVQSSVPPPPPPEPIVASEPEPEPLPPPPEPVFAAETSAVQPPPPEEVFSEPEPEPLPPTIPEAVPEEVPQTIVQSAPPQPEQVQQQAQPVAPMSDDESRNKIRTLQGMFLKHRGGPGFGSGRLRGREVETFEALLNEVSTQLGMESPAAPAEPEPLATLPPPVPQQQLAAATQVPPVVAAAPLGQPQLAAAPQVSSLAPMNVGIDAASATSSIAFVDGALQMYKNSPPQLQASMLVTVRAALVSAVNALGGTSLTVGMEPIDPASATSAIACADGAIQMYKNSPPQLQGSMLVTLQAALMSAVSSMGGASVAAQPAAVHVPPPPPPPTQAVAQPQQQAYTATAPIPQQTVPTPHQEQPQQAAAAAAVTPPAPQQPQQDEVVHHGYDKNTLKLKEVYSALQNSSGDGKYGLGAMSPQEASDLMGKVEEMRDILMEELDSGIPDGPDYEPVAPAVPVTGYEMMVEKAKQEKEMGTMSKYQQMLARAKAKKEQEKNLGGGMVQ